MQILNHDLTSEFLEQGKGGCPLGSALVLVSLRSSTVSSAAIAVSRKAREEDAASGKNQDARVDRAAASSTAVWHLEHSGAVHGETQILLAMIATDWWL